GFARIAAGAGIACRGLDHEVPAREQRRHRLGIDYDPAIAAAATLAALTADLRFIAAADPCTAVAPVAAIATLAAILALAAALPGQIDDQSALGGDFADAQHELARGGAIFAGDARSAGRAIAAGIAF